MLGLEVMLKGRPRKPWIAASLPELLAPAGGTDQCTQSITPSCSPKTHRIYFRRMKMQETAITVLPSK